jgi:hypothetical protein
MLTVIYSVMHLERKLRQIFPDSVKPPNYQIYFLTVHHYLSGWDGAL